MVWVVVSWWWFWGAFLHTVIFSFSAALLFGFFSLSPFPLSVALDTHIDRPRDKRAGWSSVFLDIFCLFTLSLFHCSYLLTSVEA